MKQLKYVILSTVVVGISNISTVAASHLGKFHGLRASDSLAKQENKNLITSLVDERGREHRLLRQACDPSPSCLGDECQFPNCSKDCPGKYILNKAPATFSEHQSIAQNKGGSLVMVQSMAKMRCMDNLVRLKNPPYIDGYWLGGRGTAGRYSWLNGDCVPQRPDDPNKHDDWCPKSPTYQRWSASQPDCYPSDTYCSSEGCMWVWYDGNWDDILCYEKKMGLYEIPASSTPVPSDNIPSTGQPLDVVFAIDITSSMCKKDLAGVTWLQRTKDAVEPFLDRMAVESPSTSMAGYVGWNSYYHSYFSIELLTADLQDLSKSLTELDCVAGDGITGYDGIRQSLRVYDASPRPDTVASTKAIVYITDNGLGTGWNTCDDDGVEVKAKEREITIYTIGYETTVEEGQGLAEMAECTGGFFRRSDGTSTTTANIYEEVFEAINN